MNRVRGYLLTTAAVSAALFIAATFSGPASAQSRHYDVPGDEVAVYDLIGDVEILGGSGSSVGVDVTLGGPDASDLKVETGRVNDTLESLPSPAARLACNPPVSGNDGGHDCNPRWLARRGVDLVGRIAGADGEVVRFAEGLEASLAAGDEFLAAFKRRVDEYVSLSGLDVSEAEPEEPPMPAHHVPELDLGAAGVGTVLWATGFRPDHSWIEGVETDEQGWPLHERGVSPVATKR